MAEDDNETPSTVEVLPAGDEDSDGGAEIDEELAMSETAEPIADVSEPQ